MRELYTDHRQAKLEAFDKASAELWIADSSGSLAVKGKAELA